MTSNDPANDPVERALRLLVYAPVGLVAYLKDSAPTFMEVFVSRGRREVDHAKQSVEEKLGRSKPAPPPNPSMQQRVVDGLNRVAAQAGSMGAAMAGIVANAAAPAAPNRPPAPTNDVRPSAPDTTGDAPATPAPNGADTSRSDTPPAGAAANGAGDDLPIAGYDLLSASQVIERLEGLSRDALERIRRYELAHRARRTILASIDQLTS